MNIFFITGIDTGCGKTYATGRIAKVLRHCGFNVITSKLIQTGCTGISEDIIEHRRLMECQLLPEDLAGETCSYVFSYPASPHLAAEIDNIEIKVSKLTDDINRLADKYDCILVEGAGGLYVPILKNLLTVNFIKMNDYPVVLVASSKLGSINHSLMSLESCFTNNLHLKLVLYNRIPGDDEIIANETMLIIKEWLSLHYPEGMFVEIDANDMNDKIITCFKNFIKPKLFV